MEAILKENGRYSIMVEKTLKDVNNKTVRIPMEEADVDKGMLVSELDFVNRELSRLNERKDMLTAYLDAIVLVEPPVPPENEP